MPPWKKLKNNNTYFKDKADAYVFLGGSDDDVKKKRGKVGNIGSICSRHECRQRIAIIEYEGNADMMGTKVLALNYTVRFI